MGEQFVGLLGDWLKNKHFFSFLSPSSVPCLNSEFNPIDHNTRQVKTQSKDRQNTLGYTTLHKKCKDNLVWNFFRHRDLNTAVLFIFKTILFVIEM